MLFVDDVGMFDDEVASCTGVSQSIAGCVWRALLRRWSCDCIVCYCCRHGGSDGASVRVIVRVGISKTGERIVSTVRVGGGQW